MSDGAITREGARRIMTNRCRSLALFHTHPLHLSSISFQFFSSTSPSCSPPSPKISPLFSFVLAFSRLFHSPRLTFSLCLPLATHSCPVQGAGEHSLERRCTCSFLLLNSVHQSRRCLSTDGRRPLNALHMQPETIYQQTGNANAGVEPAFMHLRSTLSL